MSYMEIREKRDDYYTIPLQRIYFDKQILHINISNFAFQRSDPGLLKEHYKMLNISQLNYFIDSLETDYTKIQEQQSTLLSMTFNNCGFTLLMIALLSLMSMLLRILLIV